MKPIRNTICILIVFFLLTSCDPKGEEFLIINDTSSNFTFEITFSKNPHCMHFSGFNDLEKRIIQTHSERTAFILRGSMKNHIHSTYNNKLNLAIINEDTLMKYKDNICYIVDNKIYTHLEFTYEEMKTNNNVITITNEDLY